MEVTTTASLLFALLFGVCFTGSDGVALRREKRGTRGYNSQCVDSQSGAVRGVGEVWLRWRGQQAESCRCTRGRQYCHYVPVVTCYVSLCYNGGTCKEAVYSNDHLCQCPPGFAGSQCEINTSEKCIMGAGNGYRGSWSISRSGAECINWNSTALRSKKYTAWRAEAHSLGLGNHNYCRNPDGDSKPWCYIYKGTQIAWEFCTLPSCPTDSNRECVLGTGRSYRGTAAVTKSGSKCLAWDSSSTSRKFYNAWRADAQTLGLGSHNFCRNPDGDLSPWCHTYKGSKLTWELCDIPKCPRSVTTITTQGPRAPNTSNGNRGTCGQRASRGSVSDLLPSYRIGGGKESDIREQPWQAAITVYRPRSRVHSFLCGGVLIDSCWVLSAAHCFHEGFAASRAQVTLGRTFRLKNSSSEQIFDVEKYWVHEQYKEDTYDNDIALLKLKPNSETGLCAVESPEVRPVCLPDTKLQLPDWTECEISGYGKEHEFSPFYAERVKQGHVRLWPQDRCVSDRLAGRVVTSNMLCAGDTRGLDDACKGDSGGPLVCPSGGRMTLMGLISWGDGCGKPDTPGVYTRVTHYIDWINSKKRSN